MSTASGTIPIGGGVPQERYTFLVPAKSPRVQVTIDPVLAEAMAEIDPDPKSKSRLIRDLALRGAEVAREDRRRRREATETLLKIVRGEIEMDFTGAREAWEEREAEVE
jgi:hypothetical protein